MGQPAIDELSQERWIELATEAEWVLRSLRGIENVDLLALFGLDPLTGRPVEPKKKHRRPGEKGPVDSRQWAQLQQEVSRAKAEVAIKPHEVPKDQWDDLDTSEGSTSAPQEPKERISPFRVPLSELGDFTQ